jgi:hypothetical protein
MTPDEENPIYPLIPTHWPIEKALTVVSFLQMGIDAIWSIYGNEMFDEMMRPSSPWHDRTGEMFRNVPEELWDEIDLQCLNTDSQNPLGPIPDDLNDDIPY